METVSLDDDEWNISSALDAAQALASTSRVFTFAPAARQTFSPAPRKPSSLYRQRAPDG
jgi:hypothetical protein